MRSRLLSYRFKHGTLVAYLALFLALGGTSYGVATGSIDSREIRNNTIRGKDIRNGTVGSADVRNLVAGDFKPGQLPAGPKGDTGARGPVGPRGPAGEDGFARFGYSIAEDVALPANGTASGLAECPSGLLPLGGGATVYDTLGTPDDLDDDVEVTNEEQDLRRSVSDFVTGNPGWAATVSNESAETDRVLVVEATCADPPASAARKRARGR